VRGRVAAIAYACAVGGVLGAGFMVLAPTLDLGLVSDDYMAVAVTRGEFAAPRHPLDAFDFAIGTADDTRAIKRLGSLPWWSPDDFRVAFLRPLSSALWLVDRALFGDDLVAYHAHSIAVWMALVTCASAFHRRWLSLPTALVATAIFAFDQSQFAPVLWLCNRGALYAVLIGLLGLWAHLRWRESGHARFAWLSALAATVGVLFGEWALPMFAYVAAYELCRRERPWLRRLLGTLPTALPALAFLVVRGVLGYGAYGSGIYVDPLATPGRFLLLLLTRIPVFAADMLANVPSEWWDRGSPWRDGILRLEVIPPPVWNALPGWHVFHTALGLLALAGFSWLLRASLRELPAAQQKTATWLSLGALLSLLPVAGSFPSTRLTLAAMFGASGALALVLRYLLRRLIASSRGPLGRFLAVWVLIVGLGYVQLIEPLRTNMNVDVEGLSTARAWVSSSELDDAHVAKQRVMMLASSEFITTYFWAYTWHYHGRPMPRSYYPISNSPTAHDIERPAPNVLIVRPLGALLLESPGEQMFRAPELTWQQGARVVLPGMEVRVEDTRDGYPTAVRLTFEVPLEDPSLVFLSSTEKGFTRVELPQVGQTLRLPAAARPSFLGLLGAQERERYGPFPEELWYVPAPWFLDYQP